MQVSLLSLVYTWNDCEKWTNANTDHLTQTHQLCTRQVICQDVQYLHVFSRVFGVLHADFHYKTTMGNIGIVTWNSAMARRQLSIADRGRALLGSKMVQHNEMLRRGWMWVRVSLAGSGKGFRAQDALIIGDVPGDPDQPPSEKTGTSQTWHYVNAESLPDSSVTSWGLLRVPWYPTRLSETGLERTTFGHGDLQFVHLFSNDTEQPDETGVHVMFGGNVLSGLWYSSLMSPGSPCSSMTAENVCTDVQERDLLTSTSVSVCRLVAAASWFGVLFRSMIGHLWMLLMVTLPETAICRRLFDHLSYPLCNVSRVGAVFQHDNARPHRARVVTDFLRQSNVNRLDWLAYSPYLSAIEHVWKKLGRRLRSNHAPPKMRVTEWQCKGIHFSFLFLSKTQVVGAR